MCVYCFYFSISLPLMCRGVEREERKINFHHFLFFLPPLLFVGAKKAFFGVTHKSVCKYNVNVDSLVMWSPCYDGEKIPVHSKSWMEKILIIIQMRFSNELICPQFKDDFASVNTLLCHLYIRPFWQRYDQWIIFVPGTYLVWPYLAKDVFGRAIIV